MAAYSPILRDDFSAVRTVQAISSPGVGGREIVAPTLARELTAQGHPAWVACRPGTLVERLARDWGLPVQPLGFTGYLNPAAVLAFAAFLRRERVQVIHAHWSRDLSNLLLAGALAGGVPVVLTKHVYSTESKRDPFHDALYRGVRAVIGVSRLVSENVARTTAAPRDRIETIYNGVNLKTEWNPELPLRDAKAELGLPPGAKVLGYAGRINEGKRPHLILEAFMRLAPTYPDWHWVLAGRAVGEAEEIYAERLRAGAARMGLKDRVHFLGFRDDMPAVLNAFDILVCPSEFESLGMVLVEAMAMAKPVIGSDSGGIPEIIRPGVNGELFKAGDAADLAARLEPLLADEARRDRCGREGRRLARQQFDLEMTTAQVVAVYHRVLTSPAQRRR